MRRHIQLQYEAAKDMHLEQREKIEKCKEKGLCHVCQDKPENPALSQPMCLDCYKNSEVGCMSKECTNSVKGSYRQMRFCEIHLIHAIHQTYNQYLKRKSEYNHKSQKFQDLKECSGFDPRGDEVNMEDMSEQEKRVYDTYMDMKMIHRELSHLEDQIKRGIEQVDKAFRDNFNLSI